VDKNKDDLKLPLKTTPAPVVNTEQFRKPSTATTKITTPLAPRKQKDQSASIIELAKKESSAPKKSLPQNTNSPVSKRNKEVDVDANKKESLTKLPLKDKNFNNMNEFVQTNMDKGVSDSAPEAPVSITSLWEYPFLAVNNYQTTGNVNFLLSI